MSVRVLIVDDHDMVAQGLSQALALEDDIDVLGTARTVAEGVAKARALQPDVVLVDYMLPDGDGAQAAVLMRQHDPNVRVLMITSATGDAVLPAAVEAGCSGFVPKDRSVQEVATAVRTLVRGEAYISSSALARSLPRMRRGSRAPGEDLTPREREILGLLARGRSNAAIANHLGIGLKTARNHVQNIIVKLGAHSKLEAVTTAIREGVVRP